MQRSQSNAVVSDRQPLFRRTFRKDRNYFGFLWASIVGLPTRWWPFRCAKTYTTAGEQV